MLDKTKRNSQLVHPHVKPQTKIMSPRKTAEISPRRLPGGGNSRFVCEEIQRRRGDTQGEKRMMGNWPSIMGKSCINATIKTFKREAVSWSGAISGCCCSLESTGQRQIRNSGAHSGGDLL